MVVNNSKIAFDKLRDYDKIVIFHHIRPDGDCLGSQFGLREALRNTFPQKEVLAIGDRQGLFDFLELEHDQIPSIEFMNNALAVIVDANYRERIQNQELLDNFKETLRIDHHPNEDDLPNVTRWIDASYVAAAQMVAELVIDFDFKINQNSATPLYLGIHTDSGGFKFQKTTAKTFRTVAKLVELGANKDLINKSLSLSTLNDIKFNSFVVNSLKSVENVVYSVITQKDLKSHHMSDQSGMRPNLIGNIQGFPIWVTFLEEESSKIRVEFRSNGPVVRNVAVKWNGGGHEQASGAMIDNLNQVIDVVNDCVIEAKNWK